MNVLTNLAQRRGLIAAAVAGLIVLALYVVSQLDPWAERGADLPASFQLDLQRQFAVDPQLIRYAMDSEIRVPMAEVHGLATGADDRIYVAGDRSVQVFRPDGQSEAVFPLSGPPSCLAVAGADTPNRAACISVWVGRSKCCTPTAARQANGRCLALHPY